MKIKIKYKKLKLRKRAVGAFNKNSGLLTNKMVNVSKAEVHKIMKWEEAILYLHDK